MIHCKLSKLPFMAQFSMRFAFWITKAKTHNQIVYLLLFHGINGFANAPQY
jgi:hypothetical protein